MGINPEAARQFLSVAVPIYVLWFLAGIVIATLYHLSLYYLDGEYRDRHEISLDLLVGILRGLAYVLVWPAIFYFDRTALFRIKMLFRYMDPKLRYEDEELAGFIAEGRRRVKLRQDTIANAAREERRAHELLTGEERSRYLFTVHDGNPASRTASEAAIFIFSFWTISFNPFRGSPDYRNWARFRIIFWVPFIFGKASIRKPR